MLFTSRPDGGNRDFQKVKTNPVESFEHQLKLFFFHSEVDEYNIVLQELGKRAWGLFWQYI